MRLKTDYTKTEFADTPECLDYPVFLDVHKTLKLRGTLEFLDYP